MLTNIRLRHDLKGCHDGANKFAEVYCIYIVMEPARKKQQNQSSKSIQNNPLKTKSYYNSSISIMVTFVTFLYFIVTIPLSALAVPVAQSNILIPNENGELVYATPSQLAAREVKSMEKSLLKRDACSDQTVPSDYFTCMQYCERSSAVIQGPAVKGKCDRGTFIILS